MHTYRFTTFLLFCIASFSLATSACSKDKSESKSKSSASSGARALSSPTLCEHVMTLDMELEESSCIMKLDGLQIQLGDEGWKIHGSCIANAGSKADYESCIATADKASIEKFNAQ